ncbi:universal stress protein [Candidatus Halobonum tyrrellensis]|uniref:Universal stress protein n=1 Tax=Candidatus Halobonum tyrrellensis G22 TaxID=1324957 RepID=V4HGK5_9EURY|nr:universal stress protein [Candidatus Halobonum tyrrellensis]ESP89825.1 universal stress protein [Candidatus Halobonum tyrrellensis G22]
MHDRILLPTDGSDVARAATEAAITIADQFDAELHVVHALELGELPPGFEDDDADEFAHRGEEAVTTATEMAAEAGVDATGTILEDGQPTHRAILAYADDHDVDCIVIGTYGRTGLDRFVLGSVAERTLRESPVPVVTVHEETAVDSTFDSVLVPTDGSDCASAAADHAVDLATTTDAALHVVNVVDPGILGEGSDPATLLDALEKTGERAIERVIDRADESGVPTVEATVLNGAPYRAIVDYADERDVGCIVMGTHGRTGWDRYLLGSVTERVVRLTDVPVISVKDRS